MQAVSVLCISGTFFLRQRLFFLEYARVCVLYYKEGMGKEPLHASVYCNTRHHYYFYLNYVLIRCANPRFHLF